MKLKTGSMEFAIDEMKSDLPTTSSFNSLQENIGQKQNIYIENKSVRKPGVKYVYGMSIKHLDL